MNSDIKAIGKRLESIAKNRGINKNILAKNSGIPMNTVTAILSGSDMKLSTLIHIARVLDDKAWLKHLLEVSELTPMERYYQTHKKKAIKKPLHQGGPRSRAMGRKAQ